LGRKQPASELVEEVADSFQKGRAKASIENPTVSDNRPQLGGSSDSGSMWEETLRAFGLVHDPFSVNYVLAHPSLFTTQTRLTLSRLAERAGFAAESKTNMLLVGPEGSGRTLFLRSLAKNLAQTMGKDAAAYVDVAGTKRNHEEEESNEDSLASILELPNSEGLVLLDNADRLVGQILERPPLFEAGKGKMPTFIFGIGYPTYSSIRANAQQSKRFKVHLWAPLQEKWETERMLRDLVESSALKSDPFEPNAYKVLSARAMGLPGLATDLANASLQVANGVGAPQVTKVIVDKVAEYLLYNRANQLLSGDIKLQGTKGDIAYEALRRFYMEGEVRRSAFLSAFGNLSKSTLAYHLKGLVSEQVLVMERFGFRVRYDIPKPIRAAMQIVVSHDISGA
jgi:ATPase family associated with various cellular activities (AAA)